MKTLVSLAALSLLLSGFGLQHASANCRLSFPRPRDGGMSSTYVSDRLYAKMQRLLTQKGYLLTTPDKDSTIPADYELSVKADHGYGCGTGLTWSDYLKMPAYNFIHFSKRGEIQLSVEKSFSAPIAVGLIAKRHLMKTLKSIPECEDLN